MGNQLGNLKQRLGRTVPQHDGSEHDPRQVFFGPTHAAAIGTVRSAHSNRTTGASRLTRIFGRPTWTCSYVGARGVVVHQRRGEGRLTTRILRFPDAGDLPDAAFENLPGGPELRRAARAAWQREQLRRRVDRSLAGSEFVFAIGYQPAT